jgi:hypothetical protein
MNWLSSENFDEVFFKFFRGNSFKNNHHHEEHEGHEEKKKTKTVSLLFLRALHGCNINMDESYIIASMTQNLIFATCRTKAGARSC